METINRNIENNIYKSRIAKNQVKKIFLTKGIVKFNKKTFFDITTTDKFDTKYFGSRFITFVSLYHTDFDINFVSMLNQEPLLNLSEEAQKIYKSYSRFVYYRDKENDYIRLPIEYYYELTKRYNLLGEELDDYTPAENMTTELKTFMDFFERTYKYIIFETLRTKCITDWFYNSMSLKFNTKKYCFEEDKEDN